MLAVEAHEDDLLVVGDLGEQKAGDPILSTGHAQGLHNGWLTEGFSESTGLSGKHTKGKIYYTNLLRSSASRSLKTWSEVP